MKTIFTALLMFFSLHAFSQEIPKSEEDFKEEVLKLRTEMNTVRENLYKSHERFKAGITAAAVGYTVTIAGGLMLGRKNDDLGKVLLYSGGAIGLSGTILLVDAYKFVGRAGKRSMPK